MFAYLAKKQYFCTPISNHSIMSQQELEAGYVGSRRIRVFLSSTFQDMQAERDYLVKNTFPAIMQIARRRNVDFSVVDLRWGVTEEEAHEGKVIEICLNQIEDTRPFFIGLIGDRYGWCPIEAWCLHGGKTDLR